MAHLKYTRAQWYDTWGDMVLTNHSAASNQQRSIVAHAQRVPAHHLDDHFPILHNIILMVTRE